MGFFVQNSLQILIYFAHNSLYDITIIEKSFINNTFNRIIHLLFVQYLKFVRLIS